MITDTTSPATRERLVAPYIARGPLTLEGRSKALEDENQLTLQRFVEGSFGVRAWSPFIVPHKEIRRYGSRLSEETVTIIEGFFGIEEFIADYLSAGLTEAPRMSVYSSITLIWAGEEWRHGAGLEEILVHSGKKTRQQIDEYEAKRNQNFWSPKQHRGVEGILGIIVYGVVQEKETYESYIRLHDRVRNEYGLPVEFTPDEIRLGRELGGLSYLRRTARDEIAHHGMYLALTRSHLKYFPDETAVIIQEVLEGFTMPAIRLIPNSMAFLRAIIKSGLYTRDMQQKRVFDHVLRALGFSNQDAFDIFAEDARNNLVLKSMETQTLSVGKASTFPL